MAAGTVNVTKILDAIGVAVAAVTGMAGARTFQGYKVFGESENLNDDVRALTAQSQGYFDFDLGPRSAGSAIGMGEMKVVGELRARLPKDTTTDVNSVYELAERVLRACMLEATFSGSGGQVKSGSYSIRDDEHKDSVVIFDYELTYGLGPIC